MTDPPRFHNPPPPDPAELGEVGTCALCGQIMVRTEDDCWHPYYVPIACPWEPSPWDLRARNTWLATGHSTLRPGRQYFIPAGNDG